MTAGETRSRLTAEEVARAYNLPVDLVEGTRRMTPSRIAYIAAAVCFGLVLLGVATGLNLTALGLMLVAIGLAL